MKIILSDYSLANGKNVVRLKAILEQIQLAIKTLKSFIWRVATNTCEIFAL
jgi:hypothetical protein